MANNERKGFKSIKGLTKLFKSDIPMKDEGKSGDKDKNVAYIAGPSTWKQWKERAKQDAPVSNQQMYTPPTTLEFEIRRPDGQRKAAPPPPPPPPPAAPVSAHEAALQNGYQPQNNAKLNKKLGKKSYRNYVFINEYHSNSNSNQDINGFLTLPDSVSTQNSNTQYYKSQDHIKPPLSFRKPFDIRKVRVYNIHDGAVGRKDRFKGQ